MNATVWMIIVIVFVVVPIGFLKQWFIGNRFTGNRMKDRYGRRTPSDPAQKQHGRDA